MHKRREPLPDETIITMEYDENNKFGYKIMGGPIGEGGTSLIYRAKSTIPGDSNIYALKEAYPLDGAFRNMKEDDSDYLTIDSDEDSENLNIAKQTIMNEYEINSKICRCNISIIKVNLVKDTIKIESRPINNTMLVMDDFSDKLISSKSFVEDYRFNHYDLKETIDIMYSLLTTLAIVHEKNGYVHLDLSYNNVYLAYVTKNEQRNSISVILSDFGSAKEINKQCSSGSIMATQGFCDPLLLETCIVKESNDLFSAGKLFLYYLTHDLNLLIRIDKVLRDEETFKKNLLTELKCYAVSNNIKEEIINIIFKCTSLNGKRYENCEQALEDIKNLKNIIPNYDSNIRKYEYSKVNNEYVFNDEYINSKFDTGKVIGICGGPGVGKTVLACQYANNQKDACDTIFINCENQNKFKEEMEIFEVYGNFEEYVVNCIKKHFDCGDTRGLVIFDNVGYSYNSSHNIHRDDAWISKMKTIIQLLSKELYLSIVYTSHEPLFKNSEFSNHKTICLEGFPYEYAIDYLTQNSGINQQEAKKIIEMYGNLPIVLNSIKHLFKNGEHSISFDNVQSLNMIVDNIMGKFEAETKQLLYTIALLPPDTELSTVKLFSGLEEKNVEKLIFSDKENYGLIKLMDSGEQYRISMHRSYQMSILTVGEEKKQLIDRFTQTLNQVSWKNMYDSDKVKLIQQNESIVSRMLELDNKKVIEVDKCKLLDNFVLISWCFGYFMKDSKTSRKYSQIIEKYKKKSKFLYLLNKINQMILKWENYQIQTDVESWNEEIIEIERQITILDDKRQMILQYRLYILKIKYLIGSLSEETNNLLNKAYEESKNLYEEIHEKIDMKDDIDLHDFLLISHNILTIEYLEYQKRNGLELHRAIEILKEASYDLNNNYRYYRYYGFHDKSKFKWIKAHLLNKQAVYIFEQQNPSLEELEESVSLLLLSQHDFEESMKFSMNNFENLFLVYRKIATTKINKKEDGQLEMCLARVFIELSKFIMQLVGKNPLKNDQARYNKYLFNYYNDLFRMKNMNCDKKQLDEKQLIEALEDLGVISEGKIVYNLAKIEINNLFDQCEFDFEKKTTLLDMINKAKFHIKATIDHYIEDIDCKTKEEVYDLVKRGQDSNELITDIRYLAVCYRKLGRLSTNREEALGIFNQARHYADISLFLAESFYSERGTNLAKGEIISIENEKMDWGN